MLLVFGSINLDLAIDVPHLPVPGETVLGGDLRRAPGGKGANQAHAAQRCGVATRLVGAVGADELAAPALALLRSAGVDLTGVRALDGVPTGVASICVAAGGENAIAVAPGANARVQADWVDDTQLAACRALLLQGELPLAASLDLARRARAQGLVTLMNPSPLPTAALPPEAFDWLLVNRTELQQLADRLGLPASAPDARAQALARVQACGLLLTLGADGALLVDADGVHACCPALAGPVVDTTGAGDTCAGVFAALLVQGTSPARALRHAVTAASLACRAAGAQGAQPTRAAIDAALAATDSPTADNACP